MPKEYISVQPAYGRDYKSQREVTADYDAGKDFEITDLFHGNGRKVNKDDAPAGSVLCVRYAKQMKQVNIDVDAARDKAARAKVSA